LTLWDVERRMRPLFTQACVARSEENFPEGLLREGRRKPGWMRRKPHVMIERAIAAKAAFSFVAADTVYGVGDIETALGRAGRG
jgi:SRSO17 transposase